MSVSLMMICCKFIDYLYQRITHDKISITMADDNKNSNIGCLILFVIGVIGSIIYTICNTSAEEFAETGMLVMFGVTCLIIYLLFRAFKGSSDSRSDSRSSAAPSSDKSDNVGCLKALGIGVGVLVLAGIIFSAIGTDFEFNMGLGIAVTVIATIVIAVFFYANIKD